MGLSQTHSSLGWEFLACQPHRQFLCEFCFLLSSMYVHIHYTYACMTVCVHVFVFETGFNVSQAVLELVMWLRLTLNSHSSCHHTRFLRCWRLKPGLQHARQALCRLSYILAFPAYLPVYSLLYHPYPSPLFSAGISSAGWALHFPHSDDGGESSGIL